MRAVVRFSVLSATVLLALSPAQAIEPQAPEKLISADEAVLISIRSQITNAKLPARPTQTQKGAAIDRNGLAKFYASLGEQADGGQETGRPLWVSKFGLNEKARAALRVIAKSAEWGFDPDDFNMPEHSTDNSSSLNSRELVALEMQTSLAILKYARYARGGQMDPKDLSLDIDRTPSLLPAGDVLGGVHDAEDVSAFMQDLHPKHVQFVKLRAAYLKALEDEADGVATVANESGGNSKKRRKSRRRTLLSKRLLYNMEMWRWMPQELGDVYVMPNIPEYRIRVIKKGLIIHSERIVTGKVANKTPIFSDELETVVFRPNWGIPNSIKVKEILPKIMRGKGIDRQGFRVQSGGRDIDPRSVNWAQVDIRNYHIYQPPGQRNALGLVKFLFPNKHAVYFHDTPSKYLFKRKARAYSHGCMRVRDPMKMAAVIFGEDRGWGQSKIDEIARSGVNNRQIRLNKKIPVHVTYFTARANQDGEIEMVKDVYGHEKLIQLGFDGKAHTIVKPSRSLEKFLKGRTGGSQVAGYQYNQYKPKKSRAWMRDIWGN
jgi:murein L,D-transpeptidase YcbB/YkuD